MKLLSFAQCLLRLKKFCPLSRPVRLELVPLLQRTGNVGESLVRSAEYILRIDSRMDEMTRIDTLLHEWAHLLSLRMEAEVHGPIWGVCHARCYRVAVEGQKS
jgi:hypothetical protein